MHNPLSVKSFLNSWTVFFTPKCTFTPLTTWYWWIILPFLSLKVTTWCRKGSSLTFEGCNLNMCKYIFIIYYIQWKTLGFMIDAACLMPYTVERAWKHRLSLTLQDVNKSSFLNAHRRLSALCWWRLTFTLLIVQNVLYDLSKVFIDKFIAVSRLLLGALWCKWSGTWLFWRLNHVLTGSLMWLYIWGNFKHCLIFADV